MPKIFYGWWIVAAGFGIEALIGALMFHAYGAYVDERADVVRAQEIDQLGERARRVADRPHARECSAA